MSFETENDKQKDLIAIEKIMPVLHFLQKTGNPAFRSVTVDYYQE